MSDLRVVAYSKANGLHSRPATAADLVAALIAEGGEIVPLCIEHDPFVMRGGHSKDCVAAPHLVFGPIPVDGEIP